MLHVFGIISYRFCARVLHVGLGEGTRPKEAIAKSWLEKFVGYIGGMRNGVRLLGISIAVIDIILLVDQFALPDRLFTPLAMALAAHGFRLLGDIFQLLSLFDGAKLRERDIQHGLGSEHWNLLLLGLRLCENHRLGSRRDFLFESIL